MGDGFHTRGPGRKKRAAAVLRSIPEGGREAERGTRMAPTTSLPRECFELLTAVAWSDGALDPPEAEAILRAAREAGLTEEDLARVERATKDREAASNVGELDVSKLRDEDRLFVYAASTWVASVDGSPSEKERAMLSVIGFVLRVTPKGRAEMDAAVQAIREKGDAPERFDLTGLRAAIDARVREAEARAK